MQKILLTLLLSFLFCSIFGQAGRGYSPGYTFLQSGNIVLDKDSYLITAIGQSSKVKNLLAGDDSLAGILQKQVALIRAHISDTCRTAESLVSGFRWRKEDSLRVDGAFRRIYGRQPAPFDALVDGQLRPSGYYQRFVGSGNLDLLLRAWGQCVVGINYILDQYGLGRKLRYPAIDSVSYDVRGEYYQDLLKALFPFLHERADSMTLFVQPSLALAWELMRANDRDEPARFEPLEQGENRAATARVKTLDWSRYKYTAILVPGEGPELATVPFDPIGRMRCDLAADRYKKGLAPFIIVSGGYCHPFHTPYCEAIEMKHYLTREWGIPEAAVIIEPQARHTTTNFRNACRLIIRYGMPVERPSLCVTTKDQADYIDDPRFGNRCRRELGYLPYRDLRRTSDHEFTFLPVMECLHMDPYDPLDP
ncbi:MAG TPA: YdcF family protein [Puia sp.]|nr:YdcF family protein [Puia sp.]